MPLNPLTVSIPSSTTNHSSIVHNARRSVSPQKQQTNSQRKLPSDFLEEGPARVFERYPSKLEKAYAEPRLQ